MGQEGSHEAENSVTTQEGEPGRWALCVKTPNTALLGLEQAGITAPLKPWTIRLHDEIGGPRPQGLRPGPWWDMYCVVFSSVAQAREVLPMMSEEGRTKRLSVLIETMHDDLVQLHSVTGQFVNFRTGRYGSEKSGWYASIDSDEWLDVRSAVHRVLSPRGSGGSTLPLNGRRIAITDLSSSAWAAGDPLARALSESPTDWPREDVDSADALVTPSCIKLGQIKSNGSSSGSIATLSIAEVGLPPVDTSVISPRGFQTYDYRGVARLVERFDRPGWHLFEIEGGTTRTSKIASFEKLDENVLHLLRDYSHVEADTVRNENEWDYARLASQLCVAGVLLIDRAMSPNVRRLLGNDLSFALDQAGSHLGSPVERESTSISCRRAALQAFIPRRRWHVVESGRTGINRKDPTVSVLLVTKRAEYLMHILPQIQRQSWGSLELVAVLHGVDRLTSEQEMTLQNYTGEATILRADENLSFGAALNLATDVASGQIVAKMDDDDWYGPHHIEDLVLAREYSSAALVGCQVEFTYLDGIDVTTRRRYAGERYSDHVAGGSMLMSRSDLLELGGWRSTASAVDRGVIDTVLASGGVVYRGHGQNYMMHRRRPLTGRPHHTWDADASVFVTDNDEQWPGLHFPPQMQLNGSDVPQRGRSAEFSSQLSWNGKAE